MIAYEAGRVTALWTQSYDIAPSVWFNRHLPGIGWGEPAELDAGAFLGEVGIDAAGNARAGRAFRYQAIAIDSAGNALLVRTENTAQPDATPRIDVWATRFNPATGWSESMLLETDDRGPAAAPSVAFAPSGEAIAAWVQASGIPGLGFPFDVYAANHRR